MIIAFLGYLVAHNGIISLGFAEIASTRVVTISQNIHMSHFHQTNLYAWICHTYTLLLSPIFSKLLK